MSRLRWTLHSLFSHWRRHPVQLVSLVVGLWLATALLVGVLALNAQARLSYSQASALFGKTQISLEARTGERLPQAAFVDLRRQGWPVSPVLQGRIALDGLERPVALLGIEPVTLPPHTGVAGATTPAQTLAFISPPGMTWIAPETLQEWGLSAREPLRRADGEPLPPLQARPGLAPGVLVVDIGQAQRLLGAENELSRLVLPAGFHRDLPALWRDRLVLHSSDQGEELERLTDSFHLNLMALGLLAFAVGLFIVHAAIGLAVEQRRPLLRTLRASGLTTAELILALVTELGTLALLGGSLGVISGYLLAGVLLPDMAASLRGLYGAEVPGQLTLSAWWWLGGLSLSLSGALVAGADSLWRSARLPLLALDHTQAWRCSHRLWLKRQGIAAVAVALLALGLWWPGKGLGSGLVLMGCVLLAAALSLPVLLNALLAGLCAHTRHPLARWFVADARQQLPAISQALMALLLALAANVGAGSMTEGFRHTFADWLTQRLSAQLYLRPATASQGEALLAWLPTQPGVHAVLPVYEQELPLAGRPATLAGVVDNALYRDHWPLLDSVSDAWRRLYRQDGVMLNEQLARRLHVAPGDTLPVPGANGAWPAVVLATYADYGNPHGHLLMAQSRLHELWPQAPLIRLAVLMDPMRVEALGSDIQTRYDMARSRVSDQRQLHEYASQIFERTFSATAALNVLTLGVAGIALFIALLGQSGNRLGQLAPLWALGVERQTLLWLTLGQTASLTLLTLLLAIPLGILLAWCLVAVVNVQAFGWRLPLQVFPDQLLRLFVVALLATVLASVGPLIKLWRSQPLDLVRRLAHDR